tara:strand:+ start:2177 stop:2473 length:297 start_codon:yes stop_codon:yes gene_type:complete
MKTKGLKIAMIAVAISLFAACKMNAQNSGGERQGKERPTVAEIFKQLDKDEDGKLSKEEIKGPLKNDFAKIDTDEDGFITKAELQKAPKPTRRERPRN